MNLFLDTSAIIKIYHEEKGTKEFSKYLSGFSEELLITISDITKIELHSALLKKFRTKDISKKNLFEAFRLLDKDFQKFNIIEGTSIIKNIAVTLIDELGIKFRITTLDSIQLASAIFFNNYSKIDQFISSDKILLNISKEFFTILNPEDL